jgi:hypothetical protein
MVRRFGCWLVVAWFAAGVIPASAADKIWQVGAARVDITPDYPIRLTGYAVRKTESEGIAQRLDARALAIGSDEENPAILITVDNCGVPAGVRNEVFEWLRTQTHLTTERLAICSTHTHSGPWLEGFAPNIFGAPIPPEQQARVHRYTRELTEALERVALEALKTRAPARLFWAKTQAGFAANRRTKDGPVDQALPVLLVMAPGGDLRALFTSYACHCTTLGGDFNQICGDWAGFAAQNIEQDHPGTIALLGLGCAGDANPAPRGTLDLAREHGKEIATAIEPFIAGGTSISSAPGKLLPLTGKLACRSTQIELPFDALPSRAEWERRAVETNYSGGHARLNLARLDRGETLPTSIAYFLETWTFDNQLTMVFLPGEVVVDYSLRLKREFDASRLWVNAYANDVPCYIPSERVLQEGGYEGGGAMIYYDRPVRFAPGVEDRIISAVHELVDTRFLGASEKADIISHGKTTQ